eukprot:gb/GECG01010286.1/.p1 GENE.gb/GECG01010286.1/~~gb/GECG01010286.1/.p1  ORF type:complete len:344 (+),score=26.92 gb/GECG01010286.1/:1-1032(+)
MRKRNHWIVKVMEACVLRIMMSTWMQLSGGQDFYLRPFYLPNDNPLEEHVRHLLDTRENDSAANMKIRAIKRSKELFEQDVREMSKMANDIEIKRGVRDSFPHPYTEEHGRKFLLSIKRDYGDDVNKYWQQPSHFAIVASDTDAIIGECTAQQMDDPCYDGVRLHDYSLGYWINPKHWGRGIATRALALLVAYVFESFSYAQRVHAEMYAFNKASARVLEKLGFTKEAHHRLPYLKMGKFVDSYVYGILRCDYEHIVHGEVTESTLSVSSETTACSFAANKDEVQRRLERARQEVLDPPGQQASCANASICTSFRSIRSTCRSSVVDIPLATTYSCSFPRAGS